MTTTLPSVPPAGARSLGAMPRLVVAPDKFRGTATAAQIVDAVTATARSEGWEVVGAPMADGGEGTLDALGGPNRSTTVTGPLGDPVEAAWRLDRRRAVIEMARASGLDLVGGADGNDAVAASTFGTGELISAAVDAGARRVIVGLGGSATTDGGLGALRALPPLPRLSGVELVAACDVRATFVRAAVLFAPQKGATPPQVELLRRRLERLVDVYRDDYGVDVSEMPRAGAAGGLAGGLAAIGASLVDGFELIAEEVGLADAVEGADLVVTGEGHLDGESFDGKVVGGVSGLAAEFGVPCLVITGSADPDLDPTLCAGFELVDLTEWVGEVAARSSTAELVAAAVAERLGHSIA